MGTRFELVLEDGDRAAGEAALEVIERWDQQLSAFRRDSVVARLNREARAPVQLDEETYGLFAACLEIGRASGGTFDVGLGRHMAAAGFRDAGDGSEAASMSSGTEAPFALDPERRTLRFTRPDVQLDLGAIGKGFALDRAADELRDAGVERALVHGGTSSSIALGAPPERSGWGVAIARANGEEGPTVSLCDRSLSVSAPHGRIAQGGGHVLDPATGAPTAPGVLVAVTSTSATLADAWATALAVHAARGTEPPPLPIDLTLELFESRELSAT
jgi:thiamine biosynthesis lipoprotein